MTIDPDVRRRSVTSEDYESQSQPLSIVVAPADWRGNGLLDHIRGATGLPAPGTRARDQILAESTRVEDLWSAAIYQAISRQAALGWRIEDDNQSEIRMRRSHELLLTFDGAYIAGIQRHLRDYLLTNNGAFVEIVRASNARGSRILGLMHLDSLRCTRTDDPAYPILYESLRGHVHRIPAENVIMLSDLPSARADGRGAGQCAADRAWATIVKRAAIELYFREKVAGTRNLALHFITGVNAERLRAALSANDQDQRQQGFVLYRGSTIIPLLAGSGETPTLITIPLAEIPDGFDVDQERRAANLIYANAIGIPVQDIEPLSGQGLGTGTQSIILAESAAGQGLATWRRAWQHVITHRVLPASTTFYLDVNDPRDRQARATALSTVASAVGALVDRGILRADQALSVLVDEGVLDKAYLPAPSVAGGLMADIDKPIEADAQAEAQLMPPPPPALATKADDDALDALLNAEQEEALIWAQEALDDAA